MESILAFFGDFPAWITALLSLMVGAKAIVALTPTPKDDEIVGKIYKVIEFLALNIGRAKEPGQRSGSGPKLPPPPPPPGGGG